MPIDPNSIQTHGLFKLFWETHNDPDLAGGGLNEITSQGAQKLYQYALDHEIDGSKSAAAKKAIGQDEKDLVRALLEHPHYGAFFEQDGRVKLMELFGLKAADIHYPDAVKPDDMGELKLPARVSLIDARRMESIAITNLPELFKREFTQRRAELEGGAGTAEEKGIKLLGLLADYAKALWARGEQPETEKVGHALLDAFEKSRYANVVGSKNFNGAPWSAAQSLILGLDPNRFETDFPKANCDVPATYLAMNDAMARPMKHVDEWLKLKGQPTGAEQVELRSPLGFMLGEPNGHNKRGSLEESRPFSTSGLNWGIAMFPGDKEVKGLPPKAGFEFPIDCLDGFGNFVRCDPKYGERIRAVDDQGRELKMEKVVHKNAEGKAESWSARFLAADGKEVEPSKVSGQIVDRQGRVKGDGATKGSVNMWWWGFCDRNTAQKVYKARYQLPQLDQESIKIKAGDKAITIPKADAQMLLDADVPDLVTGETFCGFRFNNEPQTVSLKDGRNLVGRIAGELMEQAGAANRLGGDMVALFHDAKRPLLGTIDVMVDGKVETFNVKNLKSIEKDEATGQVTINLASGWRTQIKGEPKTSIPWDKATLQDGKRVLTQTDQYPIRGELKMTLQNGQETKVALESVNQIVGEMQSELRLSQYMTWVSQNQGVYATDASKGEVVSNGPRWTNLIEQDVRHGEERPKWAPTGDLSGVEGPLERQPGDKIVWVRGRYSMSADGEANNNSFAGWVQIGKHGRVVNEGFTEGMPDFGWSAKGELNWSARSSFNEFMEPEFRLGVMVNGLAALKTDGPETEALAKRLNLPAGWRSHRADG